MLFNSYQFIIFFFPLVLATFFIVARYSYQLAAAWLGLASLWFYASWHYQDLYLLLLSIVGNYAAGYWLAKLASNHRKILLWVSISINLIILAYFKYSNFLVDNWNNIFDQHQSFAKVALPLGISFFTFTQIAFLVDSYRGKVKEFNPVHYLLFVTYLPHLIAGPILHHQEMISQFQNRKMYRWKSRNLVNGLLMFTIGLAKKVILADGVVGYVTPVFNAAKEGLNITWADAWLGALAYTVQLYFDFSGYSDMAIGISLLLGVKLPINFNSPYKAVNITEFWRRWHITLSNFLRDYLYISLGGNRHGQLRRYLNLIVTMLLGGLWHGAGWTFIIWGGLHGVYLVINHAWQWARKQLGQDLKQSSWWGRLAGRTITFIAVVVAWVLLRAESVESAKTILQAMFSIPMFGNIWIFQTIENPVEASLWVSILLGIIWLCPNSESLIKSFKSKIDQIQIVTALPHKIDLVNLKTKIFVANLPIWLQNYQVWHSTIVGMTLPLILILVAISESQSIKEFIYFNF
jgi:alginate O-acetyltransferase complex protein AlgI